MLAKPIPEQELVANNIVFYFGQTSEDAPIDVTQLFIALIHNKGESKNAGNTNYRKLRFFSESMNREVSREEFESAVFYSQGKNTAQCRNYYVIPLNLFDEGDIYGSCKKILKRSIQQLVSRFNEIKDNATNSKAESNEVERILNGLHRAKSALTILKAKANIDVPVPKAMETILASREPIEPEN